MFSSILAAEASGAERVVVAFGSSLYELYGILALWLLSAFLSALRRQELPAALEGQISHATAAGSTVWGAK